MRTKLIALVFVLLAACGDPPDVGPLDWNIRASDCQNLVGVELVRDLSAIGWCTVRGPLPTSLGVGDSELDLPVGIPEPPVEPEHLDVSSLTEMTDPYRNVWNLGAIRAHEAQEVVEGQGVKVMVIDTGIAIHQDLPRATDCLDTISGTDGCTDGHGHGTHVAGIIAMIKGNEYGGVGVAPRVGIGACKALTDNGSGTVSSVVACILESVRLDYDVVNMSLGAQTSSNALWDALNYAADAGVVLVAACGNNGRSPVGGLCENPGAHPRVISVGAVDPTMYVPEWVNGGADLTAPGVDILSTVRDNGYFRWAGTSMASPHVAAAAALYLANGGTGDVLQSVVGTTKEIECPSRRCGSGLLDTYALLTQDPAPTPTPQPPPTLIPPTPYPSPTEEATAEPSPFPTSTDTPTPITCGVVVPQVAAWTDVDRWWHYSGAAYLNWLARDQEYWSFQPLDLGDDYMHLSIVADDPAVCEAFKTLFSKAGYVTE